MPQLPISPSTFAQVFRQFENHIRTESESPETFTDFQHGYVQQEEGYKAGVYHKAKEILAVPTWKKTSIGEGKILENVIGSIEIRTWNGIRNNLVEWQSKGRPPEAVSHAKLLAARHSPPLRMATENALFRMYAEQEDAESCFNELTTLLGQRYDLIAYLFFLRNGEAFMPARPSHFPQAFKLFGIDYPMVKNCTWENYQGYLKILCEVQRLLKAIGIPGEIRLLDAHSFCWILRRLKNLPDQGPDAEVVNIIPEPGISPNWKINDAGFTQDELERKLREQKALGFEAQRIVLREEKARLRKLGLENLAHQVKDISYEVSRGYDIESFTDTGAPKRIEVKAVANLGDDLRFFLSENERHRSLTLEGYTFALVTGVSTDTPRILEFLGPDLPEVALRPVNYEVRLKKTTDESIFTLHDS